MYTDASAAMPAGAWTKCIMHMEETRRRSHPMENMDGSPAATTKPRAGNANGGRQGNGKGSTNASGAGGGAKCIGKCGGKGSGSKPTTDTTNHTSIGPSTHKPTAKAPPKERLDPIDLDLEEVEYNDPDRVDRFIDKKRPNYYGVRCRE